MRPACCSYFTPKLYATFSCISKQNLTWCICVLQITNDIIRYIRINTNYLCIIKNSYVTGDSIKIGKYTCICKS